MKEEGDRRAWRRRAGWIICGMGCLLSKQKSLAGARLFCFDSISSEYHTERINWPNIFEGIKM
jgi:hypothetical protein